MASYGGSARDYSSTGAYYQTDAGHQQPSSGPMPGQFVYLQQATTQRYQGPPQQMMMQQAPAQQPQPQYQRPPQQMMMQQAPAQQPQPQSQQQQGTKICFYVKEGQKLPDGPFLVQIARDSATNSAASYSNQGIDWGNII